MEGYNRVVNSKPATAPTINYGGVSQFYTIGTISSSSQKNSQNVDVNIDLSDYSSNPQNSNTPSQPMGTNYNVNTPNQPTNTSQLTTPESQIPDNVTKDLNKIFDMLDKGKITDFSKINSKMNLPIPCAGKNGEESFCILTLEELKKTGLIDSDILRLINQEITYEKLIDEIYNSKNNERLKLLIEASELNNIKDKFPEYNITGNSLEDLQNQINSLKNELNNYNSSGITPELATLKLIEYMKNNNCDLEEAKKNVVLYYAGYDQAGNYQIYYNLDQEANGFTNFSMMQAGMLPVYFSDAYNDSDAYRALESRLQNTTKTTGFIFTSTTNVHVLTDADKNALINDLQSKVAAQLTPKEMVAKRDELSAQINALQQIHDSLDETITHTVNNILSYTKKSNFDSNSHPPASAKNVLDEIVNKDCNFESYTFINNKADVAALLSLVFNDDPAANNILNRIFLSSKTSQIINLYVDDEVFNRYIKIYTAMKQDGEAESMELKVFNYIYNTDGAEAAYDYLDRISKSIDNRWYRDKQLADSEWAQEHPILASIYSVLVTPLEGIAASISSLSSVISNKPIYRSDVYSAGNVYRSSVSNAIRTGAYAPAGHENDGCWSALAFTYDTGMSMLDTGAMIATTVLTGGSGLAFNICISAGMMGSRVYVGSLNDALDRGVSDGAAVTYAFATATVESLMESYSLGHLMNLEKSLGNGVRKSVETISKKYNNQLVTKGAYIIGCAISQGIAEGEEELCTEIIDTFVDNIICGDLSNWELSVKNYMEQGETEDQAILHTFIDKSGECAMAFAGGFASGICFGGAKGCKVVNTVTKTQIEMHVGRNLMSEINTPHQNNNNTQHTSSITLAEQLMESKVDASGKKAAQAEFGNLTGELIQYYDLAGEMEMGTQFANNILCESILKMDVGTSLTDFSTEMSNTIKEATAKMSFVSDILNNQPKASADVKALSTVVEFLKAKGYVDTGSLVSQGTAVNPIVEVDVEIPSLITDTVSNDTVVAADAGSLVENLPDVSTDISQVADTISKQSEQLNSSMNENTQVEVLDFKISSVFENIPIDNEGFANKLNEIKNITEEMLPEGFATVEDYKKAFVRELISSGKLNELSNPAVYGMISDDVLYRELAGTDKLSLLYANNFLNKSLVESLMKLEQTEFNKIFNNDIMRNRLDAMSYDEFSIFMRNFAGTVNTNTLWLSNEAILNKIVSLSTEDVIKLFSIKEFKYISSLSESLGKLDNKQVAIDFFKNLVDTHFSVDKIIQDYSYRITLLDNYCNYDIENTADFNVIAKDIKTAMNNAQTYLFQLLNQNSSVKFTNIVNVTEDGYYDLVYEIGGKTYVESILVIDGRIDLGKLFAKNNDVIQAALDGNFSLKAIEKNGLKTLLYIPDTAGLQHGLNKITYLVDGEEKIFFENYKYGSINLFNRAYEDFKNATSVELKSIEALGDFEIFDGISENKIYLVTYESGGKQYQFYKCAISNYSGVSLQLNEMILANPDLSDVSNLKIMEVSQEEINALSLNLRDRSAYNDIFTDSSYGGDQSNVPNLIHALYEGKELTGISRKKAELIDSVIDKYFPNATQMERLNLAEHYAEGGCAWMAISNAFLTYMGSIEGGKEAFNNIIGFDLSFQENGKTSYNLEAFALEMYLTFATNEYNGISDILKKESSAGISAAEFDNKVTKYFKNKGIGFKATLGDSNKIGNSLFSSLLGNQHRFNILSAFDFDMELQGECSLDKTNYDRAASNNWDGSVRKKVGGHAMLITDVSNGEITVTSWEMKFKYLVDSVNNYENSHASIWSIDFDLGDRVVDAVKARADTSTLTGATTALNIATLADELKAKRVIK